MKWILYDFKTAKEPWFEQAKEIYLKKIKPFATFEIHSLKTVSRDRDESEIKKKFEEKQLIEKISKDDYIILFDENGKKLDSIQFSKLIEQAMHSGKKRGVFVIGGAYGVSENVKTLSQQKICLSNMTMNHVVAETVFLEQFYRAHTILNRIPYHNG